MRSLLATAIITAACLHAWADAAVAGNPAQSSPAAGARPQSGASVSAAASAAAQSPEQGTWTSYDFVPGDRVLFYTDFTDDQLGDFARRLDFLQGNMEVAEWQGGRYLRVTSASAFDVTLPEVLPERFTVEMDVLVPAGWSMHFDGVDANGDEGDHAVIEFGPGPAGIRGGKGGWATGTTSADLAGKIFHARVMADGAGFKIYENGERLASLPNADFLRTDKLHFSLLGAPDRPTLIGSIRIAEGSTPILYDVLRQDGHVATHGILFDAGSASLRPESTPTLKAIAGMLRAHPDLKIRIEGYTDNVGPSEDNQKLSDARAAAVRDYLVRAEHIDPSRLTSAGLGDTNPVATNDTPEGRQTNRRLELVRMS